MNDTNSKLSRRNLLAGSAALALGACHSTLSAQEQPDGETASQGMGPIRFCLNTSTLRGHKLSLPEVIPIVSKAGYDGIEPWIDEIEAYQKTGAPLSDLRKQIADAGLKVESAIGFAPWIVDDDAARKKGLEQMQRDMDRVAALGGALIAAPPVGMHQSDSPRVDLFRAAERYRAILEIGEQTGVTPQAEIWGFSPNLSRLGETVLVAVESGHPNACILPDVYHIYRGGSEFTGLGLLNNTAIHCFHFNDYPNSEDRSKLDDSQRVYPGEGDAPWDDLIEILKRIGFSGAVSLELFNRDYWMQDPQAVAATGLKRMKAVLARA